MESRSYGTFMVLKEKRNLSIRNYTSGKKQCFKNGEIKIFPDKQKLGEFVTDSPVLQEILKGILQIEMKGH